MEVVLTRIKCRQTRVKHDRYQVKTGHFIVGVVFIDRFDGERNCEIEMPNDLSGGRCEIYFLNLNVELCI